MDILAHMLWANYGARVGNKKLEKKKKPLIRLGWVTFFGVFPDLFAFAIPMILATPTILASGLSRDNHHFGISEVLYQYSHSLVLWAVVFLVVWAIYKRPRYELLGWALHILIDIPSHGNGFYLTPFLFPVSEYRFTHGIPWSNLYYMIINYSLLLISSLYLFKKKKVSTNEKAL
jgi:hypothetical protein